MSVERAFGLVWGSKEECAFALVTFPCEPLEKAARLSLGYSGFGVSMIELGSRRAESRYFQLLAGRARERGTLVVAKHRGGLHGNARPLLVPETLSRLPTVRWPLSETAPRALV